MRENSQTGPALESLLRRRAVKRVITLVGLPSYRQSPHRTEGIDELISAGMVQLA
jgi:hypothetical protein